METILIVDDDSDLRWNLSNILKEEGYNTMAVGDGRRALRVVKKNPPDLLLLDIKLPGMDGMQVLEEMKRTDKDLIIIMLTAYGDVKDAVRAMKSGAFDYVTKPFDNEEIILIVKKALQTQYLSREVESLRKRLGERIPMGRVMGESLRIKEVYKQVNVIAPTNMTVILQGESGTGKELVAQAIHQQSLRKDNPFMAIDCGAIPETLVESELFGYEKGAFTGADSQKEGAFEQANGGTLFLDEVTNLPDAMQMKLLRVVEERRLRHLGGRRSIRVNVRIIAATITPLSESVRQGKFRADLFHRLNEFNIDLPPLRERREDIPILVKNFLDETNQELKKKVEGFSAKAMKFLLDYDWPGNVRELKNIVRRATLLTDGKHIDRSHLTLSADITKPPEDLGEGASFEEITRRVQSDLIKKALERSGGNKIKAAEILQMNRKALYRKMKSLALPD